MRERKLRSDSETNRQIIASTRRVKKFYQFFAVIIATAFISSAVTLTISASGPTGFGAVIEPGSNILPARFLVYGEDSSQYFIRDGRSGAILDSGTNATSIINSALDALSAGRTQMEKVVLIGNFTLTYTVLIPSYTSLEVQGNIAMSDGANTNLFRNKGTQDQYIEVTGNGVLLGNRDHQTLGRGTALNFTKVTNSTISGIKIFEFAGDGVYWNNIGITDGRSYIRIENIESSSNGGAGIYLWNPRYFTAIHSVITKYNSHDGIFLQTPFHTIISDCSSYYNAMSGIYLNTAIECVVHSNNVAVNTLYGIHLFGGQENAVTDNVGSANNIGVRNYGSANNVISGNVMRDNIHSNVLLDHQDSDNCTVSANDLTSVSTYGTDYGVYIGNVNCCNNSVVGNILQGKGCAVDVSVLYNLGTRTLIRDNIGYVSENKGIATITTSTSVAFNHGLATTPTLVLASFSVASYGNYTWTATTTQITITVSTSGTYTVYWYAEV